MADCNSLTYKGKTYTRQELTKVLLSEGTLVQSNQTKLNSKSVEKLESFLNKAGVQVLDMSNERAKELAERSGNKNAYVNAVADTVKGIIEINAGKKDVALAEESAHILVSMLKQSNPKLYNEMYNKIGQYKIWDNVINDSFYSTSKNYQIDGKRNIPLLKEETIGKLVAEMFAKLEGENSQVDDFTYPSEDAEKASFAQTWFSRILDWFKNLFKKPGFNPFEETANILRGETNFDTKIEDVNPKIVPENIIEENKSKLDEEIDKLKSDHIQYRVKEYIGHLNGNPISSVELSSVLKDLYNNLAFFHRNLPDQEKILFNIFKILNPNLTDYEIKRNANFAEAYSTVKFNFDSDAFEERLANANMGISIDVQSILPIEVLQTEDFLNSFKKSSYADARDIKLNDTSQPSLLFQATFEPSIIYNKIQNVNNKVVQKNNTFTVNDIVIKHPFFKETTKDYSEPMKDVAEKATNDINNILSRYIDENGILRDNPTEYTAHQLGVNTKTYDALEKNISERLRTYPQGTRFLYNTILYNEAKQQATNIDFVAIKPNNSVDILTWEFLNEPKKDISKTNRENMQKYIGRVKYLLREAYDVKDFGETRAIPVIINFNVKDHKFTFKGLQIGNTKVEDITKEYLLPIPTKDEKTGDISIDKYIQKLNSLYKVINETPVIEGRRDIKYSELAAIYKAIRNLQLKRDFKPLFQQVQVQIDNTKILLDKHKEKFNNQPIEAFTDLELNEEASKLYKLAESLEIYKDLDLFFEDYFKSNFDKYEADLQEVRRITGEARSSIKDVKNTLNQFAKKYVAEKRNISNLLDAEKSVNTLDRNFRTLSQAPTKAAQTYWSIAEEWRNKSELQTLDLIEKLIEIEKDVKKWASNKNLPLSDYKKLIEKTDSKNQGVNQLIDKYDKEFYVKLKESISKKNIKWIKENIDVDKFKEWLTTYKKNKIAQIEESVYLGTKEEQIQAKKKAKLELEKLTNLETGKAYLNYIGTKQFPKDNWYSTEYKELLKEENKPLLDLYNYAVDINTKAKDSEYLEANKARTFLPFIRKTVAEKYVFGGSFNPIETLIANISIADDSVGYGNFNPLTGEIEDSIPKYFTSDISIQRKDKDGNIIQDYSNVSDDIFKNLAIYTKQVVEYEAKKNVEGLANILYFVEKNKQALQINQFGNLIENAILFPNESNEVNAKFFRNYLKNNLYGQKYITTESSDLLLGNVAEKAAKVYNKAAEKLGLPTVSEEIATRNLSAVKILDSVNRVFTLKTLGLNVASSIAQFMGGNFQAFVNTGKYYGKREFYKAEWQFASHKLIKDDENVHLALMKTFLPLGEEQLTRMMNKMSLSNLTKEGLSDLIMFMMRNADYAIQYANFLAMMDNAIVVDGKVQNVREYYRASEEYSNRYNLSNSERLKLEKDFDNKVDELKEKYGIAKKANVVDGKIKISGASEESIHKYRSLVQQIGKRAAGNITSNDENQIRMTVLGRSFMMFKNWIPNLVYQRVQPLGYIAGTDSYEYGRMRMAFKYYSWFILPNIKKIKDTIVANEQGIKDMKELYEKKRKDFLEKNGRELEISETEFYDLVRQNLEAQVRDTLLMLGLLGMFLAAKSLAPDDDEDKMVKNAYGYYLRSLDNVVNEMTFYYNPLSLQHVLGGNLFPALGVLTDISKILKSMGLELFGYVIDDEELIDAQHPTKYVMKTFPVTKEMLNYISIFDPEAAKEMGIIMSSTARR